MLKRCDDDNLWGEHTFDAGQPGTGEVKKRQPLSFFVLYNVGVFAYNEYYLFMPDFVKVMRASPRGAHSL
jgi:hypothetical protein